MRLDLADDRYARQRLITWWDQDVLAGASVLVVGAGALGNELAKNLALTGVGRLTLIDLDTVEASNLARCVLFRAGDDGRAKAEVVADRLRELNPDVSVEGLVGDVRSLGLGRLADFDLLLGGLDNREARVWVNQAARKLGRTWIDGAIEGLRGTVRVFTPEGPCYECTLGEADRRILAERRSCALLSPQEMLAGKVPTTATTASVIAAIQTQEAIKVLHGRQDLLALRNSGLVFIGETLETFPVTYSEDPYCLAHDTYAELTPYPLKATTTLADLFAAFATSGRQPVAADLEGDLVLGGECAGCAVSRTIQRFLAAADPEDGSCPSCGEALGLDVRRSLAPNDPATRIPLVDLGLPSREVVTVRSASQRTHYLLEDSG